MARQDFSENAVLQVLQAAFSEPVRCFRQDVLGRHREANYFIVGFVSFRGQPRITDCTMKSQEAVQFLNRWLSLVFPAETWTTVAISHNMVSQVHTDSGNQAGTFNCHVTVGDFSGGSLWLEDVSGKVARTTDSGEKLLGRTVDTHMRPLVFDFRLRHATMPFEGERWALTAFTAPHLGDCLLETRSRLVQLGFPLPQVQPLSHRSCRLGTSQPAPDVPVSGSYMHHFWDPKRGSVDKVSGNPAETLCQGSDVRRVSLDAPPRLVQAEQWPRTTSRQSRAEDSESHNQPPAEASSELASRLRAARPVTWRGGGDLPQLPNISAPRGTWLVLDLWAGLSGLSVALLALGLHFYGLAAEVDSAAVECVRQVMPSLVHTPRVEDIKVETLLPFVHRRKLRGIILGGGAPGLTHGSLGASRSGLSEPSTKHPALLSCLATQLRQHPDLAGVEVLVFLEGAANMQPVVCDKLSTLMQSPPVFSDARFCGWTSCGRLYWLSTATRCLGPAHCKPPFDWSWQVADQKDHHEFRYVGNKPLPKSVDWAGGFRPIFEPSLVMQGQASPFFSFTVECRHQVENAMDVPPEMLERFFQDSRRFPVHSYCEGSLLWNEKQWRQPSPPERAQILGVPDSLVQPRGPDAPTRTQRANSFLGNGFHVFTVMAIFAMLPGLCESKLKVPMSPHEPLQARLAGTLWEPDRLRAFPDLLGPEALVRDMQSQFQEFALPKAVWLETLHRLTACDLLLPQTSVAFARGTGANWQVMGPTVINQRLRAAVYTSNSGQRYSSESCKGLDFLLPPGLGKERHILAAKALPSPFQPKPWPELDIHFVLHTLAVWRESLPLLAQRQRDVLRAIHRALRPLDAALWPFRCASSQRVAHQKSPAFAACMVSLLRWPDRVPAPSALPIKRARHSRLVWCLYFAGQIAPLPLS